LSNQSLRKSAITNFNKYRSTLSGNAPFVPITATGGTIVTSGGFRYHTFTSSGTFTISKGSGFCEILVIGGGAGAASEQACGGGGAGDVQGGTIPIKIASYPVVIGAGGSPATAGATSSITETVDLPLTGWRTNSIVGSAFRSGGGPSVVPRPSIGASSQGGGGGGSAGFTVGVNHAGGVGDTDGNGYGKNGGSSFGSGSDSPSRCGGGGGGAAGAGGNGDGTSGGAGGAGTADFSAWGIATSTGQLSGSLRYYAGGGAGSSRTVNSAGGLGGGGGSTTGNGISGTANTGGGGGNGYSGTGGNGGSGIVIVRYAV
jgi:hypothetical protein